MSAVEQANANRSYLAVLPFDLCKSIVHVELHILFLHHLKEEACVLKFVSLTTIQN